MLTSSHLSDMVVGQLGPAHAFSLPHARSSAHWSSCARSPARFPEADFSLGSLPSALPQGVQPIIPGGLAPSLAWFRPRNRGHSPRRTIQGFRPACHTVCRVPRQVRTTAISLRSAVVTTSLLPLFPLSLLPLFLHQSTDFLDGRRTP